MTPTTVSALDGLLDMRAEKVAEKLKLEIATGATAELRPRLLTVDQAAAYLGRTRESLQHLIAAGKLPTVRSDRRVFLDIRDLDTWVDENKCAGL